MPTSKDKMRAILAIAVISCIFNMASSKSCQDRATDLATCIARLATATDDDDAFCRECGNSLVAYYQACANGVGVDEVKQSEFMAD